MVACVRKLTSYKYQLKWLNAGILQIMKQTN